MDELECLPLLGESVCLFIDEGDGLTSERERVRMLPSLVAHVGGYRMMIGALNTVECQMHVEGCVVFFGYGIVDACHTVDTWRHARGFTMFAWYGKCRRPQHC